MLNNDFYEYAISKKTGYMVDVIEESDDKSCFLVREKYSGKRYHLHKTDIEFVTSQFSEPEPIDWEKRLWEATLMYEFKETGKPEMFTAKGLDAINQAKALIETYKKHSK